MRVAGRFGSTGLTALPATLGQVKLTARISDLIDHADEYQHLVDPRSWAPEASRTGSSP